MGVEFESSEKITRDNSYYIATQDIDIDAENNGRHVLPDITWLIDSIREYGQKTPCIVGKNGKRAKMIEGHSRWRAICDINKGRKPEDHLKVWCVYFRGNEVDALITGFQCNRERNGLLPVDEGYFVSRMLRYGKSMEQIAQICHEDVKWCEGRLELVQLAPEAQALTGTIELTAARALAKLSADEQRRFLKSGKKVTAGVIKKFAAPQKKKSDSPSPAAKKKPSMETVYGVLRRITLNDQYPQGLNKNCTKDQLCEWLMLFMDGE